MLLSRFWYLLLSFALAAAVAILCVAQSFYNRSTERWLGSSLSADSIAVSMAVKDDARNRAAALLPIALDPDVSDGLAKASEADDIPKEAREKVKKGLASAARELAPELKFTGIWAIDAEGRVVGDYEWQHRDDWNLGGHAVVADALAGWIRDDTWVYKEKLYRVVARPAERPGGGEPVGAIVGITAVDSQYAQAISERTGAAVAFYAMGSRVSHGAPQGFPSGDFDLIQTDLSAVATTEDYAQKGRSTVRKVREDLGLVYARIPGEAWDLGSGYVVARHAVFLKTPWAVFSAADQTDKDNAPSWLLLAIALGGGLIGLLLSIVEHTLPLRTFRNAVASFAQGTIDTLSPSKFAGAYKKLAADVNDGVDKAIAKGGGGSRRAADLEQVIGPLPAKPQMSAFALPDAPQPVAAEPPRPKIIPQAPERKAAPTAPSAQARPAPPGPAPKPVAIVDRASLEEIAPDAVLPSESLPPSEPAKSEPAKSEPAKSEPAKSEPAKSEPAKSEPAKSEPESDDEETVWRGVFADFVKTKEQCGEPTEGFTFEKFRGTLERNKAALVSRHQCSAVKFTVYVKDGKAALKASPVK
jgi:hypothetical protein